MIIKCYDLTPLHLYPSSGLLHTPTLIIFNLYVIHNLILIAYNVDMSIINLAWQGFQASCFYHPIENWLEGSYLMS